MKATARHSSGQPGHEVEIRRFRFAAGAQASGEGIEGTPTPQELLAASLAACSAATIHSYAKRKGWDIGDVVVEVDYELAKRGSPTRCGVVVRMPGNLSEERRQSLMAAVATSPVHRTLEAETMFDERLELSAPEPALLNDQRARRQSRRNGSLRHFLRSSRRTA